MDSHTKVTHTDEDEIIDIEGDDDITIENDNTVIHKKCHCDKDNATKVETGNPENLSTLFKRQKKDKKTSKSVPSPENDFTRWWKSASEFQSPVTPIKKKDCDITMDNDDVSIGTTLNPILQSPKRLNETRSPFDEAESTIYDENGEVFEPPKEEIHLSPNEVGDKEREIFPEFFSGATKYSPHNYITIRNTILKLWEQKRPEHVNKVTLRPILKKGCGNVNNIGRIHRYLESIGAINFGSDAVWWKRKRRKTPDCRPPRTALDTDFKLKRALEQRMSGRSRKRPLPFTSDPGSADAMGGYTIDHANNTLVIPKPKEKKESLTKSPMSKKYSLVKCKEYRPAEDCPYDVTIHSSALIVMDVHCHLSTHEVMGLIGGYLIDDVNGKVKVKILCAHPCESSGSTRHCEMDPVSQSFACQKIAEKGLKVVGWYHSHPTFPPHPSETDISTQLDQQSVFSSHGSLFLGMILTPYYRHQIKTDANLIHVERFQDNGNVTVIPFTVPYEVDSHPLDGASKSDLLPIFSNIIEKSVGDAIKGNSSSRLCHLLDPIVQGSTVTHLDKLMKSISSFVTSQHQEPSGDVGHVHDVDVSYDDGQEFVTTFGDEEPILGSQDILTSAYEIVTSQDIMTSHTTNEEAVNSILESESYSIDQNFPSLADGGFCDDGLLNSDVTGGGGSDDVTNSHFQLSQSLIHTSWSEIFDKLKFLLLNASEKVLNK